MVEKSKLDADPQRKSVDPIRYHGMIGSLMNPTSSRLDLVFSVCMCARCCAQILWMRSQLTDYGLGFNKISLYCDNKSAITLCCNNVQHSRSKHIEIKNHFIKEQVENGVVELYFVRLEYQLTDIFTKALGRERLDFLINKIETKSMSPKTLKNMAEEVDEYWTMNPIVTQQTALDNALVAPDDRVKIRKCNMRINPSNTQTKPTYQVAYSPCYHAVLITADVLEIYMQQFWSTITKIKDSSSYQFKLD
uniref:Retrotransposon protein, putative, unclassified n=1 Tax=Tanacetum cinerariifolium TaxID=118510 RepID=A0A6L2K4I8_TANCI|nr:retrotransposon protein, putative, unclassified [Tanacetum cinerariifolium]